MATTFQKDIQPSNSTDALFRAWCTFVRDAFLAGAWVQTADTGQMNFATVTAPVAANTEQGFIDLRMDDSLQGSFPVYLRVGFGSGPGASIPALWFAVGTGTNGTGAITGAVLQHASPEIYCASNGTGRVNSSHSSASTSHCAVSLFVESTAAFSITFSIERGRTSAGAEDGAYVFLQYATGAGGGRVNRFHYLVRSGGTQVGQTAAPVVTCPSRPMHTQQDVGYGNVIPIKPSGVFQIPAPPCLGYIVTEQDSWTTDAVIVVYKYGVPVVYRRLNVERVDTPGATPTTNHVVWQRYE